MVTVQYVCGVPMGGLPGETPTLLAGSMFFDRHKVVRDAHLGVFDEEAALSLLRLQDAWAEKTGNPACLDVIASTPQAMQRYLDFVAEHFSGPIMIDGSDAQVKIAGIEHMAAEGFSDRIIYNSITPGTSQKELDAIEACRVTAVVVLAVDPSDFSVEGKMRVLSDDFGLLLKVRAKGVQHFLVDPGVLDLLSVGVVRDVMERSQQMGYLAGTAPHNAIGTWKGMTSKFGHEFKSCATAVLNALPVAWGADFIIYGPIGLSPTVFPAVAMVDAILAQALLDQGKIPDANHPMFRIA
jgi:tetrahydromethanopterin S-methyltransferase subunit H